MTGLLIAWLAIGVVLMLIGLPGGRKSSGMPLAYFCGLSLIHTPGAAIYVNFPSWDELARRTYIGFDETVIGMAAFLGGVIIARYFAPRPVDQDLSQIGTSALRQTDRLALYYLIGGAIYFEVGSLASIPSLGALIATLSSLLVVGASLRIWTALQEGRQVKLFLTVAVLPVLPVITTLRGGFINYGVYWLLSIASFAFAQTKRRLIFFAISPLIVFVGLSIFINYMASRTAYRNLTWGHETSLQERFDAFANMFRDFQWLNGDSEKQRELINGRLNQNILVGAAAERLDSSAVEYANGSTLVDLAIGLIPRALWPDKPAVGGGGTVVQEYAGGKIADGTSVGAGQVLEFYINFGRAGLIGGFLIYGMLIGWMDLRIIESLYAGDQKRTLMWFMMCLAMLQPGGNLLEIVVSVVAAGVVARLIGYFIVRQSPGPPVSASFLRRRVT